VKPSLFFAAALALAACAVPGAAAQPSSEARQIGWVLERGRLLFGIDRAAWVATDDLLERVPDAEAKGVRGYLVERDPDGFSVTFFARDGQRFVAAYRARVGRGGVERPQVFEGSARPELTPFQLRLARAVETAREKAGQLQRCGQQPFNVTVVPPETADGPIDVYLMAPQTAAGFPIGGHHRITLDAAGKETARRAFARSCLTLNKAPDEAGAQPVGMVVSHLLDPIPTEIHVFTALAAEMPVYVAVDRPRRLFEVGSQGISVVRVPNRR
jgi:hypothetical protein